MGCNCKNKNKEITKKEMPQQELQEAKEVALATIEEMELALNTMNQNPAAKQKLQKFMMDTFGELVSNYCDTVCRKRLKGRLDKLKTEIK